MKHFKIFLVLGIFLTFCSTVWGDIPKLINFQGILDSSGTPLANRTVSVEFKIYNDPTASLPANIKWSETQSVTTDASGRFNVLLGTSTAIPDTAFKGTDRYLGIKVASDPEMTPRQRLVSIPYTYEFDDTGPDSIIADSGKAFLGKAIGNTFSPMYGVYGTAQNSSNTYFGYGADAYGGYFTAIDTGQGLHYGVYGSAAGNYYNSSYGVYGSATNGYPYTYGVYGSAINSSYGGTPYGGYFESSSPGGVQTTAIRGIASDNTSSYYGTYGANCNAENLGSGDVYGGLFTASSGYSGTGSQIGVYAQGFGTNAPISYGAICSGSSDTGSAVGISAGASHGFSGSSNPVYGGYFSAYFDHGTGNAYGVYLNTQTYAAGTSYGVYSDAYTGDIAPVYAGYFRASGFGTGKKYGLYAQAPPTEGYAGYFQGDVRITDSLIVLGGKSAAVKIDNGEYHLLYSMESPENWFEDFGEAELFNGKAAVQIDPLFAQTVNTKVKYHVFLTPQDEPLTLAVTNKTLTSFEVIGPAGSNISFSYRIVAKRRGFENLRLAKMKGPTPEEFALEQAQQQSKVEEQRTKLEQQRKEMEENHKKMLEKTQNK